MSARQLHEETYLPETAAEPVAKVYDFLQAHEATKGTRPAPRYFLAGSSSGDRVELPEELYRALRQVVEALQNGLAVTVAPRGQRLTTQQAADLLGVSRPTVIKLLDDGKIPYERIGTHRKIKLRDLLEYRERRRADQYAALDAMAVDIDDEDDLETALEHLRAARKTVAERHRS